MTTRKFAEGSPYDGNEQLRTAQEMFGQPNTVKILNYVFYHLFIMLASFGLTILIPSLLCAHSKPASVRRDDSGGLAQKRLPEVAMRSKCLSSSISGCLIERMSIKGALKEVRGIETI